LVRGITKMLGIRNSFPSAPRSVIRGSHRIARIAGMGVCALVAGLVACASPPEAARRRPGARDFPSLDGALSDVAAALLSRAIQYDTTNPPGAERPLAEYLAAVLDRAGIEARVIPLPGEDSPRAALWARVPGRGQRAPLVLLSHLDVVPATEHDWAVDPFAGVIGGGYVVGRGALDAKGVAITHLLTLVELARREQPLARDVILLATPDEETGGALGAGLIARDHRELLRGAAYLLTEGGGILPGESYERDVWGVAFTEKTPCWVKLTARGVPGHGSTASDGSAPDRLVDALARVHAIPHELRVTPEVAEMFARMAPLARADEQAQWRELRGALALNPDFRARFLSDPGRRALVQNTTSVTMLHGSESPNVVPAIATATVDARLLPGESCPAFVAQMAAAIDDSAVELSVTLEFPALASPIETPLMTAIERVAERADPRGFVVPRVISGFTDAHYFRALGITAYSFVPRRLRLQDTLGIHGPNERASLENLELGIETTKAILLELERVEAE
jgi:acetylornithine deacetylase/succinyl-diaminopimelate desuccinylase-like protein